LGAAGGLAGVLVAGCFRLGVNTHALGERLARLEELVNALYEYIEQLEEA